MKRIVLLLLTYTVICSLSINIPSKQSNVVRAIVVLNNPELGIKGVVKFEEENDRTTITINVSGLTPGKHGFHVHEFGNLTKGCSSTGGHYNPFAMTHGGPIDVHRHTGDLGNVEADSSGNVNIVKVDLYIKLTGEFSVIGRGVVLHHDYDDFGRVLFII
jgi:Cu-Zn family superoxide dismutase